MGTIISKSSPYFLNIKFVPYKTILIFEEIGDWLTKAGLVIRCFNTKAIKRPLELNVDRTYFKAFISDMGLLMALYPISVSQAFLNEELDSRKGAIYENLCATMINKCGLPLYYFSNGQDHLEIDFLIEDIDGVILFEEKSTNGKMLASRNVMEGNSPYKGKRCYKIIKENIGKGPFYLSVSQYATPFVLEQIKDNINKGVELKKIRIS